MKKTTTLRFPTALLSLVCLFFPGKAGARVVRVEIESREPVLSGDRFGPGGEYEKLAGKIHFAFDPKHSRNRAVVDLDLAPRNPQGEVEAWGDFMVLRPVAQKGTQKSTGLLEVSNRGGKAALGYFNQAQFSTDPTTKEHFGDGLLMRRGMTVIWVGWQFDVPRDPGRLRLRVPELRGETPITGLVRCDWTVEDPVSTLALGHRGHRPYRSVAPEDASHVLTVRKSRYGPRTVVPRGQWSFVQREKGRSLDEETDSEGGNGRWTGIRVDGGFEAGSIYELVYRATQPSIVGLGLLAIRDTMSYAKQDPECPFPVGKGIALGISQTGRFLRHFLYQGFNVDEKDRGVFDGVLAHTAGAGRGSFNHRFAQPSRDGHRNSAFFYPTDLFPFSGRSQRDPESGRRDGLLRKLSEGGGTACPKVFYTNTGYEYWGRAGSLLHTSLDGSADVPPLDCERIYHLASGQHFVRGFDPREEHRVPGTNAYRGNPLDFLATERALLVALQDWVERGTSPPPSRYPTIDEGTLVDCTEVAFPKIPGVQLPQVLHQAHRLDFGPRFLPEGLVTREPPGLGSAFPSLVSQVDRFGNELGGVPSVETLVPVATFTPWFLQDGTPGQTRELMDFYGTYIPLSAREADRKHRGDFRPSLETLYRNRTEYRNRAELAARQLIADRYLLAEDRERVCDRALQQWDWIHAQVSREDPRPRNEPQVGEKKRNEHD